MKYAVVVEKCMYFTGVVEVEAETEGLAFGMVCDQINSGALQTSSIEWDEGQYQDCSFSTTGDINPAEESDESNDPLIGTFISYWDDGAAIETFATFSNGVIVADMSSDDSDHGCLLSEKFVCGDEEYRVCDLCHDGIMKSEPGESVGQHIFARHVCSNPECCNEEIDE